MAAARKFESQLISKFQKGCEVIKQGHDYEAALLPEASQVLSTTTSTFALRKLAAEFLHRSGCRRSDWIGLAAAIDVDGPTFLLALVRRWLDSYGGNSQIGSSTDEFIFYSTFVQRISKERQFLRTELGKDDFTYLRRQLVFVSLTLSELRSENCTSIFKSVVKLNESREELLEMAVICREVSIFLPGNLLLVSLISKELGVPIPFFDEYLSAVPVWARQQELASASSPLIAELLRICPEKTTEAIVPCLLAKNHAVVANVLRCWLHRWTTLAAGHEHVWSILNTLEEQIQKQFSRSKEAYWPPKVENFEDWTCIDPFWKWEESAGVTWPEDRLLNAFLRTLETLLDKFPAKNVEKYRLQMDSKVTVLKMGLVWHDGEIREMARRLGGYLSLEDTTGADHRVARQDGGEEGLLRDKVYLPDELALPEMPSDSQKLTEIVDELLRKHGSDREGHVPPFPTVHMKLRQIGMEERLFVKMITDSIGRIASSNEMAGERAASLFDIVARTRLKAIVDAGCTALEGLFARETALAEAYFPKLLDYLLSSATEIRTLVLSRLLWSCCLSRQPLFEVFFDGVEPYLSMETDATVLARILKTVKHFVAQADCNFPARSYPVLFSFCLEVQNSGNFLTRSAATIVFGFLLKNITKSRKLPLFVLIGGQSVLWNRWREDKLHELSRLPRSQRILLLTMLRKYILVHTEFYSEKELGTLSRLLTEINAIRETSPDMRERRFCVDVLVQLTPNGKHQKLCHLMKNDENSRNGLEDVKYLEYRLSLFLGKDSKRPFSEEQVPVLVGDSHYYQLQQSFFESGADLAGLSETSDWDNELDLQNLAIASETVAWNESEDHMVETLYSKLCNHPYPRVRSLAARIPVAAGKETIYKTAGC